MDKRQRTFFIVSFVIIIALSIAIVYSFLPALLTGAILAYLSTPLYRLLNKRIKRPAATSFLVIIIVVFIIIVPLVFALNVISGEAYAFYLVARDTSQGSFFNIECANDEGIMCKGISQIGGRLSDSEITYYLGEAVKKGTLFLVDATSNFIFSIPARMLDLFIALFVMFYLIKDGEKLVKGFWKFIPFKKEQERRIQKKFTDVTSAVVYGHLLTSFAQGIIGGMGFYIFGISNPVIWGMIIAIAAFIPVVGTALVWGPASLYLIGVGVYADNLPTVFRGVGLLLYGLFVISLVDNFIKPKVIGGRARVHPALILVGLLGGIKLLGLIGVIYGPLILALLVTFFDIYKDEFAK
jgi:predicted PurR-regulated permease PerM